MSTAYGYLLVFLGAGLGGALRHLTNLVTQRAVGPDLPVSTLVVNVLGSLILGAIAGHFAVRGHGSQALQLFLTTGILGGSQRSRRSRWKRRSSGSGGKCSASSCLWVRP